MRRTTAVAEAYDAPSEFERGRGLLQTIKRSGRIESAIGFVVGIAVAATSLLAVLSAAAGVLGDGSDVGIFLGIAAVLAVVGGGMIQVFRPPPRLRSSAAFLGMVTVWLSVIAVSTLTYWALGTFRFLDDALFESASGFTTTATTVVPDPELLSDATLFWRAGTQWLGGLGGLLFVVAVLPSLGVGGLDVTSAGTRYSGTSLLSRNTSGLLRRLTGLYATFTAAGIVLYLLGGMNVFDAATYAATTISTGGFGNHRGSFGHFESTLVEWAGIGGMVLGGMNMALVFRVLRGGDPRRFLRSFELRAYLAALVLGGAILAATTMPEGGVTHESIRYAYFHVASATSTTGHFVGDGWGGWAVGPQTLLLAIMGVGSMSGSAGGGFRQVRALALVGYLRRELILQVQPRAVAPVRVGSRIVSDELVGRMIGYQAQYLVAAVAGATVLGVFGTDVVTALSGAISALANMGPALGDLVPGRGGVLQLPRPARAALMPLMLLGRLEIAPVLVGASIAWTSVRLVVHR